MSDKILRSIVCPGCSCLCDDIDIRVSGGSVLQINNVCSWGIGRFVGGKKFAQKKERKRPEGHYISDKKERIAVSVDEACAKAAHIIEKSKRIFIYGLCQCGNRAQARIYEMGKRLNATFIPSEGPLLTLFLKQSVQNGFSLCTLEEVRNRADVVVFWGANPIHSCPRLVSRYAIFARGRFTERGEEDRKAFIVDLQPTELTKLCNEVILKDGNDLALLKAIRKLLKGEKPDNYGTVKPRHARKLAEALNEGLYIAFFCGRGPFYGEEGETFLRELIELVKFLNREKNCVLLPLATDFNTVGFYHVILRNADVDFLKNSVMHDVRSWEPRTGDVIIGLGSDFVWFLSDEQKRAMKEKEVRIVSISSYETLTHVNSSVALSCAMAGIEVEDLCFRLDSIPVKLSAIMEPVFPADWEILEKLDALL